MCDPYSDRRHLLVEAYILYTNVYSPRVGLCWELISICYRARINGCVLLRNYATKWTYFEYNRCHNCFSHFPSIRFGYIVHMNIQTIFPRSPFLEPESTTFARFVAALSIFTYSQTHTERLVETADSKHLHIIKYGKMTKLISHGYKPQR